MMVVGIIYSFHHKQKLEIVSKIHLNPRIILYAMLFSRFPFKRPEILDMWIKAIRRENWKPSKTSRICGQHFVDTDYINKPGTSLKLLKPEAIPSVFPYPKHLVKKPSTRRVIKKW